MHDIAEFAGQRQLTFTFHQRGFGSQYLASDFGPGKTRYESNFIVRFVAVRTVLWNTDVVNYIFVADRDAVLRAFFDDNARHLPANR